MEVEGSFIAAHYKFKIILLGEENVGKSAFNKFCSNRFESHLEQLHEQVYGVSFAVKILKNIDIEMTLVVWNFTGQERYKTVQPHYMKGVSGILLLFDLTRLETFTKLPDWLEFIKRHDATVPILLIGTKADLFYLKDVTDTGIENFVNMNKLRGYYEVSFKTGLNVETVIQKMSELIYETRVKNQKILKEFKLNRKDPNLPLILEEDRVRTEYILTLKTIFEMAFNDFSARIKNIEPQLQKAQNSKDILKINQLREETEKISFELADYNKMIDKILQTPPVPIPTYLKLNLFDDWKKKIDKLRHTILGFKDVFKHLAKPE